MKTDNKIAVIIAIVAFTFAGLWMLPTKGCVESNFLLANDSRLPKFIKLPEQFNRNDVTVSLFLYTGGDARFIVRGPAPARKTLMNIVAKAGWHEATLREEKRRGSMEFRPHYYAVKFEGVDDIIKFPCLGPVFWMADGIDNNTVETHIDTKNGILSPRCPPIDDNLIGSPR